MDGSNLYDYGWGNRKATKVKKALENGDSELHEQIKLVTWMTKNAIVFYAIPNEGKRTYGAGILAKKKGLQKGAPDLCIPMARHGYNALYIEMKRKVGGRLGDEQRYWLEVLTKEGNLALMAKGFEEAQQIVIDYLDKNCSRFKC